MRGKNLAAAAAVFAAFLSAASFAQFTGPSAAGGTRASAHGACSRADRPITQAQDHEAPGGGAIRRRVLWPPQRHVE